MANRLTQKQSTALDYLRKNPGASPAQVCTAAAVSTWGNNHAEFLWRLLTSHPDRVRLTVTDPPTEEPKP